MFGIRLLGVVVLTCVACAAPAKNPPKAEQKLSKKDERRGEEEPIVAPPPRYGNKVVKDDRPQPETHAKDEGAECRIREAGAEEDEGVSPTECQPTRTFVQ